MAAPILTENEINAKFNQAEARSQEWDFPELDGLYAEHEDKISPPVKEEPEPKTEPTKEESSGIMSQEAIEKLVSVQKETEEKSSSPAQKPQSPKEENSGIMDQEAIEKLVAAQKPQPPEEENSGVMDQEAIEKLVATQKTQPPEEKNSGVMDQEAIEKLVATQKTRSPKEDSSAIMDPDDIAALVANLSEQQTEDTTEALAMEPEETEIKLTKPDLKALEQEKPEQMTSETPTKKDEDSSGMMAQDEIEDMLNFMNKSKKSAVEKQAEQEEEEKSAIDPNPSPEELEALLGSGISDEEDNVDESDILAADDIAASFTQKEVPAELSMAAKTTAEVKTSEIENTSGLDDDSELQNVITAKLEKAEFPLPEDKTENLEQSMERLLSGTTKIQNTISDIENTEEESTTQFDEKAFAEILRPIQEKTSSKTKENTSNQKVSLHERPAANKTIKRRIPLPGLKNTLFTLGAVALIILAFMPDNMNPLQKILSLFKTNTEINTLSQWQLNPNPNSEVRAHFKVEWQGKLVRGALSYLNGFHIVDSEPKTENNEISPYLIRNAIETYYSSLEGPKNKLGRERWLTNSGKIGENEPHFYVNYFTPANNNGHFIRKSLFLQHENGILKLDLISTPEKEEDILSRSSNSWRALNGVMEKKLAGSVSHHQEDESPNLKISDPNKFAQSLLELYQQAKQQITQ